MPPVAEFPKVAKTVLARGFAESHKLCAWQRRPYQTCLPINKRLKQATLRRMVLKQLVTDAHAPVTNFKHCESDWLLHKLLTSIGILDGCNGTTGACHNICSCVCSNSYTSVSYCCYVVIRFVEVQPGFSFKP